jgi:glucose/arabinose dehydrogenase
LPLSAQEKKGGKTAAAEADYYKLIEIPIPENITLEVGAMECMPDGRLAVSTRRGDVYMLENAYEDPAKNVKFTRWATGLHEVLGLAYNPKDGFLYAVQRGEVTKLKDTDSDGRADVYETFCDGWAISGDYHEYPIGSKFDKDGNLYVVLCLTGSFTSDVPYRGWCVQVTPDGKMHPFASGIRSPAGIGFNHLGDLFYCDNQGPWNGTSSFKQLVKGSFQGHPDGNKWYDLPEVKAELGEPPKTPLSKSRFHVEAAKIPEYIPPPLLLPHGKIGQSASGIQCDFSGGKFGPFATHMFLGDQHHSNLTRGVLEKVKGRYQGACIPFREGFASGVVPVIQAPDGSLFVGGTNRGWGSVGPKEFALERVVWTGKVPFEIYDMKVKPDGFELTFTEPLDKAAASEVANYDLKTYTYIYQSDYGSPEVDRTDPTIKSATLGANGKSVRLVIDGLQIGHVHELKVEKLRSKEGKPLLHPVAYYTLWNLPDGKD